MPIINDGEIFARVHKFKMFRKEGNLFIDVYEALLGKPASKFIAVPNLMIQEADKAYFGFGDSMATALKDCMKKIKDVPIHIIVPPDSRLEHGITLNNSPGFGREAIPESELDSKDLPGNVSELLGTIRGIVRADPSRPEYPYEEIITTRDRKERSEPIKNARVTAKCRGERKRTTRTDASGRYEFTGLKDGIWELKVKAKGYDEIQAVVDISGGGEYIQDF